MVWAWARTGSEDASGSHELEARWLDVLVAQLGDGGIEEGHSDVDGDGHQTQDGLAGLRHPVDKDAAPLDVLLVEGLGRHRTLLGFHPGSHFLPIFSA
jgi:hypothetical protein